MSGRLFWLLAALLGLIVALGVSTACGSSDDDDDDDSEASDDDADDDDAGESCDDVVALVSDYCAWEYDALYQTVCVEQSDSDCLSGCYDAHDACEDIQSCYENDECGG